MVGVIIGSPGYGDAQDVIGYDIGMLIMAML